MRINPLGAQVTIATALCLCCLQPADAWQYAAGATSQQIQFSPPVEGTCRLESGTVSRGHIQSISELEIVMRNPQNREITLPTSEVRTVRTSDGEFQYSPGEDDFDDAIRRAQGLSGVTIVPIYNAPANQPQPNQPPGGLGQNNPAPNQPPVGASNPAALNQPVPPQPGTGNAPTYSSTPDFSNPAPEVPFGQDTSSLPKCSVCGNPISPDARAGQTCPHCGVLFTGSPVNYPQVAASGASGGHSGYTSNPPTPQGGAVEQPAGNAQSTAAPAPATVETSNFSFEAMPMWAKAGAFVGILFVLYMVVSSRR